MKYKDVKKIFLDFDLENLFIYLFVWPFVGLIGAGILLIPVIGPIFIFIFLIFAVIFYKMLYTIDDLLF